MVLGMCAGTAKHSGGDGEDRCKPCKALCSLLGLTQPQRQFVAPLHRLPPVAPLPTGTLHRDVSHPLT